MQREKVSIIIRCKNEEDWIGHCLQAVYNQAHDNFEVIIVDSGSTDKTLDIVNSFSIDQLIVLDRYLPGYALNEGIKISNGSIVVMLSSHCVPKGTEWLNTLVSNLKGNNVAGVYGRQLPVAFSTPHDIRDLFITFGLDKRVQIKDYFFHNANSAIKKSVWKKIPFDDSATNIEDRIWGKKVTESGYQLVYEPMAEVFHHHGIHQSQNHGRAKSTLQVLKDVESFDHQELLPKTLLPKNRDIVAIIPIKTRYDSINGYDPVQNLISELRNVKNLKHTYYISTSGIIENYDLDDKSTLLKRPEKLKSESVSLGTVLKWGIVELNKANRFPDYIIYANPEYIFRPDNLIQRLIDDACYKGLDSVFVGYTEYSNYWSYDSDADDYKPFGEKLLPRTDKHPMYKSLFGLGCITRSRIVRDGDIVGQKRIGIISTSDIKHTFRVSDPYMLSILETLLLNKGRH